MNISETNVTNITKHGYELEKNIKNELFTYSVFLVISLLVGVSFNCFELYCTFKSTKCDRFGKILLTTVDLAVCVFGSACGILLNTYPVNFFNNSLCKFMLGSNMILANLSIVSILNFTTYRYFIFRNHLRQINKKKRKRLTVAGMLFAICLSIPSFIFYGETDIVFIVQNATFSGKICGTSETYENGTFFLIYPILMAVVSAGVILYLSFIQLQLTLSFFRGLKRGNQKNISFPFKTNGTSMIKKRVKTCDIYADKDFSVLYSDTLICSSCDQLEIKTLFENNGTLKMKSAYEMMLDIDISVISVSENTNLVDDTQNNFKHSNNLVFEGISRTRLITWYLMQPLVIIAFAVSTISRADTMFVKSNTWSEISEIEFTWTFIIFSVLSSASNPLFFSLFVHFTSMFEMLRNSLRVEIIRKKEK